MPQISAPAAGAVIMWGAGVLAGIGLTTPSINWGLVLGSAAISAWGVIYIKRFAEKD